MDVKGVCNALWELLKEQGGGCVDREGAEVFPFEERVQEGDPLEGLAGESSPRGLRGAVWRLTHNREWEGVWALRTLEGLQVGVITPVTETTRG